MATTTLDFTPFCYVPDGWDVFADEVSIVGERFRLEEIGEFIRALGDAVEARRAFGVRLEREPDNAHDPYAIKVVGVWKTRENEHTRHLGYLSSKLAYKVGKQIGADRPLGAILRTVELDPESPEDPINVVIDVLEPA